uniref:Uncharacterized protein n=1 Tax=Lotus japonicus TaxID=34305 RepID=I3SML4_LOTJA|nr:unknown [Lotus japonicus]
MTGYMSSIRSLCPGRESWKIRARVIRKWEIAPTSDPAKPYVLQLVLIDSEMMECWYQSVEERISASTVCPPSPKVVHDRCS